MGACFSKLNQDKNDTNPGCDITRLETQKAKRAPEGIPNQKPAVQQQQRQMYRPKDGSNTETAGSENHAMNTNGGSTGNDADGSHPPLPSKTVVRTNQDRPDLDITTISDSSRVVRELQFSTQSELKSGDPTSIYTRQRRIAVTNLGFVHIATDRKGKRVILKSSRADQRHLENPREEIRIMQLIRDKWNHKDKKDQAGDKDEQKGAVINGDHHYHQQERQQQQQQQQQQQRRHPGMIDLVEAYENKGMVHTVLEYAEGGDLFYYLMERKTLSEGEARELFRQVLSTLGFIHASCGLCHLDISLENILLSQDRKQAKLCDFGAAREIVFDAEGKEREFSCKSHGTPGKVGYMAPEIFAATIFNGRLADIFSVGVCLFMVLTGKPPFFKPGPICKYFRFLKNHGIAPIVKHYAVGLSDDAIDLLTRMIHPDATQRFASVKDILDHKWFVKTDEKNDDDDNDDDNDDGDDDDDDDNNAK